MTLQKETSGILAQLQPAASTLTVLYTVPDKKKAKVRIIIANSGVETTFDIKVAKYGAADAASQFLCDDELIRVDQSGISETLMLNEKDEVRVLAGTANLSFTVTGSESFK